MANPFDDENGEFLVLLNGEGQHSAMAEASHGRPDRR